MLNNFGYTENLAVPLEINCPKGVSIISVPNQLTKPKLNSTASTSGDLVADLGDLKLADLNQIPALCGHLLRINPEFYRDGRQAFVTKSCKI
ncbi:hypothetical protein [Moorena producens]|uniref:hypothetical protein n=1 Tax=Moorena producens TaxID=1155739 RepID=UPI003C71332D